MPRGVPGPSLALLVAGLLPLHGVGLGIFLWLAARALGADLWSGLGLKGIPPRRLITQFLVAIPLSLFFLVAVGVVSQTCVVILDVLGVPSSPPELFSFMRMDQPVLAGASILAVTVLAPFAEEIIFRFGCFEFLRSLSVAKPGLWVAGVFALIHGQLFAIPGLFLLSLLLQAARARGRGLWFPIFIHAFYNFFASFFFLLAQSLKSG